MRQAQIPKKMPQVYCAMLPEPHKAAYSEIETSSFKYFLSLAASL